MKNMKSHYASCGLNIEEVFFMQVYIKHDSYNFVFIAICTQENA